MQEKEQNPNQILKTLDVKLDFKRFFSLSLGVSVALACVSIRSITELVVFLLNYWVILGYLFFLVKGGQGMFQAALNGQRHVSKSKILLLFAGKIFLIICALSLSVLFIGNKVLVPLLNYVIHLFILALALRSRDSNSPLV